MGTIGVVEATFVAGLELNAAYYREVVEPLVRPFGHAAALLGRGSDVLGYDTARSTDHGWGPRLQVFVAEADIEPAAAAVDAGLPPTFRGWPVHYGWDEVVARHWVEVQTLRGWLTGQLGVDVLAGLSTADWLVLPQQQLLGVVRGAVYADPDDELVDARRELAWYPREVWLWMLACQWGRIGEEEAFVGRAAEVGDELGSRVITARLVRELMRLAFLLAGQYWPYTKWFGTAFSRLPGSGALGSALRAALAANDLTAREDALAKAYELLARRHNDTGLAPQVDPSVRLYHDRPFRVLGSGRFALACRARIEDPWLQEVPLVGSVDQFVDSTDVLSYPDRCRQLRAFLHAVGE